MMGERMVAQEALFYSFNLDRHVPADHLLRSIDRFVDLSAIREHLRPFYSETGRPSIDPDGHPLRAASVRRSSSEPGVSLVLPSRPRRRRARPLDLLQKPTRALPRQQP